MSKLDGTIAELIRQPARGVASGPGVRLAAWICGMGLYLIILVALVFHPRPDLADKITQPLFAAEIVALALLAVTAARSAVALSYPDSGQKRDIGAAPVLAAVLFCIILGLEFIADQPPAPAPDHGMDCCMAISFAAMPLAFFMLWSIRRMAPLAGGWAGCAALLAAFGTSALGLRLSEQTESIKHIITMHYAPMIAAGLIGVWLGKRILKF